jgi:hypothetical protein
LIMIYDTSMKKKINNPNIDNNFKTNMDKISTKVKSKVMIKYNLNL